MDDDSTRVLDRHLQVPNDDTQVLSRNAAPASAPSTQPPKKPKSFVLVMVWGLVRIGAVVFSLLLLAQTVGGLSNTPLIQWLGALLLSLIVPFFLYMWIRKALKRRSPNARVKLSALTFAFGWNLVIGMAIWATMPGISTMAVGAQGANLARGIAKVMTPDVSIANGVLKTAELSSRLTRAI